MTETVEPTLYKLADAEIRVCISAYLSLVKDTQGFSKVTKERIADERKRTILLAGLGGTNLGLKAKAAVEEWKRRQAIPFDIETGVTYSVYRSIRAKGLKLLNQLERLTKGFTRFDPKMIQQRPYFLPLLQHLVGLFSKAHLKKTVGNASDVRISKPVAERFAAYLTQRVVPSKVNKGEILKRLESTLEGIVRDLVGRVLLESIVASALKKRKIPFEREEDYPFLAGVVYNFRADFVLPNHEKPRAFIEVRKSSSRHASLYAKDKMFSAINWKGKSKNMLGVLVVDGEWTGETLRVMANVFDYVVPISRIPELVETVGAYLRGDKSKLKWLIDFRITPAISPKK
jgi:hypothetical protein